MKQYEFLSVPMTTAAMAAHGLEGWMIKAVHDGIVFMEREIEPAPPVADKMAADMPMVAEMPAPVEPPAPEMPAEMPAETSPAA